LEKQLPFVSDMNCSFKEKDSIVQINNDRTFMPLLKAKKLSEQHLTLLLQFPEILTDDQKLKMQKLVRKDPKTAKILREKKSSQ
jgi:hypothetical protein